MLEQLRKENRLQSALEYTAEQFSNLLYELVSVRKMEYHQAWELAVNEFLLPEESSSTSPSDHPETSVLPMPTESGWAARMRKRKQT
jgi:hypothetical protein